MLTIPLRLPSLANMRLHWAARAREVRSQRSTVALYWRAPPGDGVRAVAQAGGPWVVTLVRIYTHRPLDDDNLSSACKAVRDEVAKLLGVDDGDDAVRWVYEQRKGAASGVEIRVARGA